MASLPMPAVSRIAFSVKNTFVDFDSDDEQTAEDQPSRALRSFTAPAAAASDLSDEASTLEPRQEAAGAAAGARIAFSVKNTFVEVPSDDELEADHFPPRAVTAPVVAASDSDSDYVSACGSEASTPRQEEADCDADAAAPPALLGRKRPSLAKVPEADLLPAITVKNTFVDIADQSPSVGQALLCRCVTAPVTSASFSPLSDHEGSSTATPSSEDEVSSTPTPEAAVGVSAAPEELGFGTLAGAQPASPAAPTQDAASQEPEGRITATSKDGSVAVSHAGGSCAVRWTIESRRLKGNEKQLVSAPFEVTLREGAAPAVFKMMICGQSGGVETSFQRSGGVGAMCLKCCTELPEEAHRTTVVRFSVSGGHGTTAPRGPAFHQFQCILPRHQSIWDYGAASSGSSTFIVSVELSPADVARSQP